MKAISRVFFFASAVVLFAACDRHSWEAEGDDPGTKMLYEHHDDHGDDHHGEGHGEDHESAHGEAGEGDAEAH